MLCLDEPTNFLDFETVSQRQSQCVVRIAFQGSLGNLRVSQCQPPYWGIAISTSLNKALVGIWEVDLDSHDRWSVYGTFPYMYHPVLLPSENAMFNQVMQNHKAKMSRIPLLQLRSTNLGRHRYWLPQIFHSHLGEEVRIVLMSDASAIMTSLAEILQNRDFIFC